MKPDTKIVILCSCMTRGSEKKPLSASPIFKNIPAPMRMEGCRMPWAPVSISLFLDGELFSRRRVCWGDVG